MRDEDRHKVVTAICVTGNCLLLVLRDPRLYDVFV